MVGRNFFVSDTTQSINQRKAICALLSLALLLIGRLLASIPQGSDSRYGMYRGLLVGVCGTFGLIFAIASIMRHEKPALLSWLALLMSLAPYLLLFWLTLFNKL